MARAKTSPFWEERIAQLMQEPGATYSRMQKQLEDDARRLHRKDAPSLTIVGRLAKCIREKWSTERLYAAGRFHWPDSMEMGALPWEASRAALDLLRWRLDQGYERPSVQLAQWFWRVRLAEPGLTVEEANQLAAALLTNEIARRYKLDTPFTEPSWAIERRLAFRVYHAARRPADVQALEAMEKRRFVQGEPLDPPWPPGGAPELALGSGHPLSGFYLLELEGASHLRQAQQLAEEMWRRHLEEEERIKHLSSENRARARAGLPLKEDGPD